MSLSDDETLAEEVLEEAEESPEPPVTHTVTESLESGMDTGQGADDEPALAIGDRPAADAEPVSPEEARRLLGDETG